MAVTPAVIACSLLGYEEGEIGRERGSEQHSEESRPYPSHEEARHHAGNPSPSTDDLEGRLLYHLAVYPKAAKSFPFKPIFRSTTVGARCRHDCHPEGIGKGEGYSQHDHKTIRGQVERLRRVILGGKLLDLHRLPAAWLTGAPGGHSI